MGFISSLLGVHPFGINFKKIFLKCPIFDLVKNLEKNLEFVRRYVSGFTVSVYSKPRYTGFMSGINDLAMFFPRACD